MAPSEKLDKDMLDFVTKHIHSLEQLELLVILHRDPSREWTVQALDDIIRSSEDSVLARLKDLCARGFISSSVAPREAFRYGPSSENLHKAISSLVIAYKNQRIKVIEAIFTKPMAEIQSFSNAFRFRSDKGGKDNG